MNAIWTLSYADRRTLVNGLRELRRHPGRGVVWLLFLIAFAGLAVAKTMPRRVPPGTANPLGTVAVNDLVVCGLAAMFGIVLATGTERWLGFFSSRAEALLLMRAPESPVVVAAYLQVRTILSTLAGSLSRLAYLFVLAIPSGTTLSALLMQFAFFGAAAAAIASVALPRALARGVVRAASIVLGCAIVLVAALPLAADGLRAFGPAGLVATLQLVHVPHPGNVLTALSHGDLRAIAVPLLVAVIATAAFARAARDAYPELYAISQANLDFRERRRTRRAASSETAAPRTSAAITSARRSPWRGSAAFIWTDALMFSRRVSPAMTGLFAALALAAGVVLALMARSDPTMFYGVVLSTLPAVCIAVTATTGVRLAPTLRLPIFWLGDASLTARLVAWMFGAFWRYAVLVALAAGSYVAVSRDARVAGLAFIAALGFLALTRSVGLAAFALLPNALDQRGPAVLVRTLLSFVLLAPPLITGFVAAFAIGGPSPLAGTLAGTTVALAEAAALIGFAAWRLAGRVDRLNAA